MKKTICILFIFCLACGNKKNSEGVTTKDSIDATVVDTTNVDMINDTLSDTHNNPDSIIMDFARYIAENIQARKYDMITEYIHPKEGIRFSPYAYVDTNTNVKMTADEFSENWKMSNSKKKINWGPYTAGEENIELSMLDYFVKFVYNLDYVKMAQPVLNKTQFSGTIPSNLTEIYKDADYVEYYVPGVDEKYEGLDWGALQLVFKQYKGYYYLVAIIHAEWTT